MTSDGQLSADERTVTVRVPLAFRKRGGRKRVIAPNGTEACPPSPRAQVSTLVKALARAHRWQRMLESGGYASIGELAAAERINVSYVARLLRLTLLSPEIMELLLDGTQSGTWESAAWPKPFPVQWAAQRASFAPLA
jgi:hypothetical protein